MGDAGFTPGWRRYPGVGNGNSLQYSCLENCMDRGAWQTAAHGLTESDTTEQVEYILTLESILLSKENGQRVA